MTYDFYASAREWKAVPIDGVGYLQGSDLLKYEPSVLRETVERMEAERYNPDGWRTGDLWRKLMGLDDTHGKTIMDFGCGFGLEALQLARVDNHVILADINQESLDIATAVLNLYGLSPSGTVLVEGSVPYWEQMEPFDVFYSNGVLHHTPEIRGILERASDCLKDDGEVRLLLYSDKGWTWATGTPVPPIDLYIPNSPYFSFFVEKMDSVGMYADWYNEEKLQWLLGDLFEITQCEYLTRDDAYLAVRMVKR